MNEFYLIFILISIFHFSNLKFEELDLPLKKTSTFKGFVIRKINDTAIYISNYYEEIFYDFRKIPKPDPNYERNKS